jgi:YYY domain-containing protein
MTSTQPSFSPFRRFTDATLETILVLLILGAAAFFRFSGLDWGEYQFLHPDERFLVWVGTDIQPVESLSAYFDTANSSLNPHNRGHGFYVYGTFPMFVARYLVEWVYGGSGWQEMTDMGRMLSALTDLGTVFLVYLIGKRLYGRWVGLLGMAFSAAAVLQIQQSHFFTMDTFTTFFSTLALYFAVQVASSRVDESLLWPSTAFGVALGMAVASKINTVLVAFTLPAAMLIVLARTRAQERESKWPRLFAYLALAAFLSLLTFRLLQPYAFSGPGFFGLKPNPQWVENIRSQRAQASPDFDFPPNMQWARRPIWFSFQNLTVWGLGLPLGALAWTGFLWVGWRLLTVWKAKREQWLAHSLIWSWTAAYFAWQSIQLNPTMRYQLPIYPTLAIFAAWAILALFNLRQSSAPGATEVTEVAESLSRRKLVRLRWARPVSILLAGMVLLATYAYAYAFSRIYTRPITRIAASRWIYQNIPGPITLPIQTGNGVFNQILPFPYTFRITPTTPFTTTFVPKASGALAQVLLPRVRDESGASQIVTLKLALTNVASPAVPMATAVLQDNLAAAEDSRGKNIILALDPPIQLETDQSYILSLEVAESGSVPASSFSAEVWVTVAPLATEPDVSTSQTLPAAPVQPPSADHPVYEFQPQTNGQLSQLRIRGAPDTRPLTRPESLSIAVESVLGSQPGGEIIHSSLQLQEVAEGGEIILNLGAPIRVNGGETYRLTLELPPQSTAIALNGLGVANEGEWDDGLPLRMDGYDGFGGIYPLELNFNMYWDENPEKRERFLRILDEADYILISSSRQWGSLPRLPERFPMTTVYYRNLLGCPSEMSVENCYRIAEPGMFKGNLGFELVETFTSEPRLGPIRLNDQFAEEAFTVYDHPKVFIFQKTSDYDSTKARAILESVDLSKVIRVAPLRAGSYPSDLQLPDERWAEQQAGGTWSELFNVNALHNRYPLLTAVIWYLTITLLGWIAYPLLRLAAPGLEDRGYPLARIAGMLVLSYLVWLAGSLRIPATKLTIGIVLLGMAFISTWLYGRQWGEIRSELRQKRKYFLSIEGLSLAFFVAFLLIRLGNPDLWHPWKGGEKPMDFSYFNAVLKSVSFPPYDPWYAGGYLNYYYYGFVLVGVPVKLLGIVPSIAYNLILPTLFSLIVLGAFSAAWNLAQGAAAQRASKTLPVEAGRISPYIPGLAAALGMAVLGNLGTVRMLYQGFQRVAAPGGNIEGAALPTLWVWTIRGFFQVLEGARLPYGVGDWYWIPSRAIPAPGDVEPITEFPYFTVLYADLHAHLLALPLTLLTLGLIVAFLLGKGQWKQIGGGVAWFGLAGLAIGVLRPTNTWDMPTYLALAIVVVLYTWIRYFRLPDAWRQRFAFLEQLSPGFLSALAALIGAGLLVGLSLLLFQPYAQWYALGYTKIDLWKGTHTPTYSYLIHWGMFLFAILSWMAWETRDWLAKTPVSALRRLAPYRWLIQFVLILGVLLVLGLYLFNIYIAWLALPLAALAGVLLLRPEMPDAKRFVLFMVGTGLTLTLMVELIVLRGDIGRMNTVFKFYLQVWTLFSISAAAALGWVIPALPDWRPSWRAGWQILLVGLVSGAALYPIMATTAKIDDRMSKAAPHTLDGMAFMPYSVYTDEWGPMDLSQDYRAIRWIQDHIKGSPVIVEANLRNLYRWGSRFSIYTGLPGVVGWEWHQQQQRAVIPAAWISDRIREVDEFYLTDDLGAAVEFLRKYQVRYIIVGQQERGHYPGPGLDKFEAADGVFWSEVYRDGDTVIYEVIAD